MSSDEPDTALAIRFLRLLDHDAAATGSFTYQTFHDTAVKDKDEQLAHVISGPARERLLALHSRGAGVYVTVNETDGKGRCTENITRIRAVWREADADNLPDLPIDPSLIVATSPGHAHEYFLVADDWPADEQGRADFKAVMERMVESYGSDPGAKDLPRVLRVPGFLHRKNGAPHLVNIIGDADDYVRRYTRAEILTAFPPVEKPKKESKSQQHTWSNDERDDYERARDALRWIDADDRKIWIDIGMALDERFGDAGRRLWDEWSASSSKYDAHDQEKNWRSFGRRDGVTIGTLFHYAQQAGWTGNGRQHFNGSGPQQSAKSEEKAGRAKQQANGEARTIDLDEWDAGEVTGKPPPRQWLLGNQFCRGFLSGLPAPGATGKTATRTLQYLSLATGRALSGQHVFKRSRVLIVGLEDDKDEMQRRIDAACIHHCIDRTELKGWLFCANPKGLKLAESRNGTFCVGQLMDVLKAAIERRKPDLLALDPFVKLHSLAENDNTSMDFVADLLVQLADQYNIAVDAPHHTRKGLIAAGDADAGRGASAARDAGRLVYTLTRMTEDEAKAFNISPDDRDLYIRLDSGKVNIARPARGATWFKLIGVPLDNGNEEYPNGDEVQTVEPWSPPKTWDGLSSVALNAALTAIDAGMENGQRYSDAGPADKRAAWRVVERHCPNRNEAQCREIIRTWVGNRVLYNDDYDDPVERKKRKGLRLDTTKRPS